MSAVPIPRVSPQEYLRQERAAPFRSEYCAGRVYAMAGVTRAHCRIATNLSATLDNQLRDRPCNNYASDLRVSVRGGEGYYYPDVLVTCGPEVFEDDRLDCLVNPVVIIEVLSKSTEAFDRGAKFLDYQTIPSLREYVLISQSPRRFEIFRRHDDASWRYESYPFDPPLLRLESIGCTLSAEDVYRKVVPEDADEAAP